MIEVRPWAPGRLGRGHDRRGHPAGVPPVMKRKPPGPLGRTPVVNCAKHWLDWAAETNTITRFELAGALRETINLSTAADDEKRLYVCGHAPAELYVETDRLKVDRVLLNLVSNAVKFTDRGGVRVEVERTSATVR